MKLRNLSWVLILVHYSTKFLFYHDCEVRRLFNEGHFTQNFFDKRTLKNEKKKTGVNVNLPKPQLELSDYFLYHFFDYNMIGMYLTMVYINRFM